MRSRVPKWLSVLAVLASTSVGRADDLPSVWVSVDACPRLAEGELMRIVAADLGVTIADSESLASTTVVIGCRDFRIQLVVDDRLSGKRSERVIDPMVSEESSETRLAAIAASELVLASWAELAVNPEPRALPESRQSDGAMRERVQNLLTDRVEPTFPKRRRRPADDAEEEEDEEPVMRGVIVGSTRQFLGGEGRLWGLGLRVGRDHPGVVSWSVDTLFESGEVSNGGRAVSLDVMGFAGAVYFRRRWGPVIGRLGAGLRGGLTTSDARESTVSPWGWPLAALSVSLLPGGPLVFDLHGEGGYAVLPVAHDGTGGPRTIRGVWLSGQVGVGGVF